MSIYTLFKFIGGKVTPGYTTPDGKFLETPLGISGIATHRSITDWAPAANHTTPATGEVFNLTFTGHHAFEVSFVYADNAADPEPAVLFVGVAPSTITEATAISRLTAVANPTWASPQSSDDQRVMIRSGETKSFIFTSDMTQVYGYVAKKTIGTSASNYIGIRGIS